MEATCPIACSPKRCIWIFTAEEMGRRSIGWDARKAAASDGTLVAPWVLLTRAATEAGNLPSPNPTRGFRYSGTEWSRALTSRAPPPYMPSSPSSRT